MPLGRVHISSNPKTVGTQSAFLAGRTCAYPQRPDEASLGLFVRERVLVLRRRGSSSNSSTSSTSAAPPEWPLLAGIVVVSSGSTTIAAGHVTVEVRCVLVHNNTHRTLFHSAHRLTSTTTTSDSNDIIDDTTGEKTTYPFSFSFGRKALPPSYVFNCNTSSKRRSAAATVPIDHDEIWHGKNMPEGLHWCLSAKAGDMSVTLGIGVAYSYDEDHAAALDWLPAFSGRQGSSRRKNRMDSIVVDASKRSVSLPLRPLLGPRDAASRTGTLELRVLQQVAYVKPYNRGFIISRRYVGHKIVEFVGGAAVVDSEAESDEPGYVTVPLGQDGSVSTASWSWSRVLRPLLSSSYSSATLSSLIKDDADVVDIIDNTTSSTPVFQLAPSSPPVASTNAHFDCSIQISYTITASFYARGNGLIPSHSTTIPLIISSHISQTPPSPKPSLPAPMTPTRNANEMGDTAGLTESSPPSSESEAPPPPPPRRVTSISSLSTIVVQQTQQPQLPSTHAQNLTILLNDITTTLQLLSNLNAPVIPLRPIAGSGIRPVLDELHDMIRTHIVETVDVAHGQLPPWPPTHARTPFNLLALECEMSGLAAAQVEIVVAWVGACESVVVAWAAARGRGGAARARWDAAVAEFGRTREAVIAMFVSVDQSSEVGSWDMEDVEEGDEWVRKDSGVELPMAP